MRISLRANTRSLGAAFLILLLASLCLMPAAAADPIDDATSGVTDTVGDTADSAGDTAGDTGDAAGGAVGETVDDTTDTVGDTVDDATDTVDDATGGATEEVTDTVDDSVDGATDTVDDTVDDVGGTIDETTGGGSGGSSDPDQEKGSTGPPRSGSGNHSVHDGATSDAPIPAAVDAGAPASESRPPVPSHFEAPPGIASFSAFNDLAVVRIGHEPRINPEPVGIVVDELIGSASATDGSRGPVEMLLQAAAEATRRLAFPLLLAFMVGGFLSIQSRVDRKDPKLADAPVDSTQELISFE